MGTLGFLINVSTDFRTQIANFAPLHPSAALGRHSPIAGVLLTNADLDHTGGLLLLREEPALSLYATGAVRASVEAAGLAALVGEFSVLYWHMPSLHGAPLTTAQGEPSGLSYRMIALPGGPPRFDCNNHAETGHCIAYEISDERTGARLVAAPDVEAIAPELLDALALADVVFFDGTFWSSGELAAHRFGVARAEAMGHLPIGESDNGEGSLAQLNQLPARRKVFIHINNTNPILQPGSPECVAVESAGWMVGYDGWEVEL